MGLSSWSFRWKNAGVAFDCLPLLNTFLRLLRIYGKGLNGNYLVLRFGSVIWFRDFQSHLLQSITHRQKEIKSKNKNDSKKEEITKSLVTAGRSGKFYWKTECIYVLQGRYPASGGKEGFYKFEWIDKFINKYLNKFILISRGSTRSFSFNDLNAGRRSSLL